MYLAAKFTLFLFEIICDTSVTGSGNLSDCLLMFRCITCRKIPPEVTDRLCMVVEDRCRIPWKGGAIRLHLDSVFPVFLVPCSILLASVGPIWTIVSFAGTFALLFGFYRVWRQHHRVGGRRTRVFFVFGLTSIAAMYYVFVAFVVGYRELFLWEILLLSVMLAATVYYVFQARRNPGVILPESSSIPAGSRLHSLSEEHVDLSEFEVMWVDSRPIRSKFCTCSITFCHETVFMPVLKDYDRK